MLLELKNNSLKGT